MTPHISRCRVTYRMTDQMGVVYYANYLELFEIGRTELLRAAGFQYRQMERDGYFLPVVHAAADYLAPARYDDLLRIHAWIARLTRVRIDFGYEIRREDAARDRASGEGAAPAAAELLCRGVTRHALVGPDARPRRLAGTWLERLGALVEG